ncbi:MAG TPA: NifU family protein [Terriglobales bacterium]|nr:NifU family protein [Terriglobales bacterium]
MSDLTTTNQVIDITPAAVAKIAELITTRGKPGLAVRVAIRGKLPGGGYQTEFKFQERSAAQTSDVVQPAGDFDFVFEQSVADKIRGSRVDFDETRFSAGFNIEYPHHSAIPPELQQRRNWDDPFAQKVQDVIDEYINPGIASHGGWVLLKDVKDKSVFVQMGGGCQGCGMAAVTLRQGIERSIMQAVPDVKEIVDITDHEEGEDPYYAAETAGAASPLAN